MADAKITLPVKGKKNVLITSALPYVNNVPHLGNIIGSTLSADCFSRYSKQRGNPTLYICGTDEYGTATETKALEEGIEPRALCDKFHVLHKAIYDDFQIDFDYFGRTSTDFHTKIVQQIFMELWENQFLEERVTTQPFCENHNAFLADRFVEGICPRCSYDDARGDQCDQCGNLLDPFELIKPRCKVCKGAEVSPVPRDTKHVFLRLDKLQPQIEAWYAKASTEGKWSPNSIAITKSWLDKGLEGRSITRDLKWGVPVPLPGYEGKVIYVWFDACIGYPSITANYMPNDWQKWWKKEDGVDTKLYQFMGKDNTPFHAVIFPACELGTGDRWNMVHNISTTEYLNYENTKFSKSRSVGVFGDQAKDTGIPTSVFRYYLLSSRPESSDTQFEWSSFVLTNNSILLANIGNFINRIVKFVNAKFDGVVPAYTVGYVDKPSDPETKAFDFAAWVGDVQKVLDEYIGEMDAVHLRAGIEKATALSSQGNVLLQYRLDNASLEKEPERTKTVIGYGLSLCGLLAAALSPFIPATSASIAEQLNIALPLVPDAFDAGLIKPGHKIGKAAYLFSRIDDKKVAEWKEKFGGTSETKQAELEAKKKKLADKERKKAKKAAARAAEKEKAAGAEDAESAPAYPVDITNVATGKTMDLPLRTKITE